MYTKKSKPNGVKKTLIYISLTLIVLSTACNRNTEQKTIIDTYKVIAPQVIDTVYTIDYVADINSLKNVELRARINGYIEKIHVDEGQFLKKGQVIFSITNQAYKEDVLKSKAFLKSAIAEAKAAELNVLNTKILVDKNVVSKTELEMSQSKLEALHAKIDEAKSLQATTLLNLAYSEIRAPFDGIIDRIPNKVGSLINEGTLLTTISDNTEIFAYFNVSEKEYLDFFTAQELKNSKEVELILANGKTHTYKGKTETIDGEFEKTTGNISFRARFPNPQFLLKHGASGKVRIEKPIKALTIPQKSTFEVQDQTFVYVIGKDSVVHLRNITTSLRLDKSFVVTSGLSASETILYEGIQRVKEGDKIIPEPVSFSTGNPLSSNK